MFTEIVSLLESHRHSSNATAMSAYMKNKFPFLGIKKPLLEKVLKPFLEAYKAEPTIDWQLIHQLWDLPEREFQYTAMLILQVQKKRLVLEDLAEIERLISHRSWWDTVDFLATHLLGFLGLNHIESMQGTMLIWSRSSNIWIARSSLLFQLKYKTQTDTDLLAACILNNATSEEFFIRKVIGWILREYSKTNAEWVSAFIKENTLSSLSVREGSKYL